MPNFSMSLLAVIQALFLMLLAPLMTGISRQIRARMHSRRGPGVLQDYRDIFKLMKRQDVAPADSGMVFQAVPYEQLGTMLLVAMVLPVFTDRSPVAAAADLITLIYLFAFGRFLIALSGIDSGSSFAGIGASREATLGVLVEPIMMLSLFVVALITGSTNLGAISVGISHAYAQSPTAIVLALAAFAFAVFVEMGKLPFDMAEAEQELQEGPLTEYSGVALGVLKTGLAMKKVVLAQFLVGAFLPLGISAATTGGMAVLLTLLVPLKIAVVFVIAALIENSMARGRFLLTSRVTWVGFGVASLSFVFYLAGL